MKAGIGLNRHVLKMALVTLAVFLCAYLMERPSDRNDDKCTVALIPADGMTILSGNPVTVQKGESAAFEVAFSEGYSVGNNNNVRYESGKLWIDDIQASRSVLFIPQKLCALTVSEENADCIEIISGTTVFSGEEARVRIHAPAHYTAETLFVNDEAYPVPAGNEMDVSVYEDSVLSLELRGETVSVSVVSVIGSNMKISGLKEEYRYGDTLSLRAEYDRENAVFGGWSTQAYLNNGGELLSLDDELTVTITDDLEVFANLTDSKAVYSVHIDPNGGTVSKKIVLSDQAPGRPTELPADNIGITRDGYTLVGYNTRPDGEGMHYALSAPIIMPYGNITLYAEWVQNTPEDELTYVIRDNTAIITGRKNGVSSILCIPPRVGGAPVRSIDANAFKGDKALETVVLPIGVAYIFDDAFSNCVNLKNIYLPDTIKTIREDAFSNTPALQRLRVLASTDARAYDRTFNAGYADRYTRLKTTEGKRIILIAGSSGSFGLKSELLAGHYPDYSIINLSGSYQFGMRTVSHYLMNNVHQGDVIIFAPEYYDDMYANTLSEEIANWMYLESNYNMLEELNINEVRASILDTYPKFLNERRKLLPGKEKVRSVLARANFNVYGDIAVERAHRANTQMYKPEMKLIDPRGIEWFTYVFSELSSRGATCLFSFPPVSDGESGKAAWAPAYEKFTEKLVSAFENADVTVISNAADYVFAEDVFYDNRYHMTLEGAEMRTLKLIQDLDAFGIGR